MAESKKKISSSKADPVAIARRQLVHELTSLRGQLKSISARYQSNLEAKMVACNNVLSAGQEDGLPEQAKSRRKLQAMIKAVQGIKLKPQKGRLKDLRRIDTLVAEIAEQLGLD